jgi:chromosome segregation ATPase
MFFALGFLVAGLIALAIAPAFWRRALRLTRRRLETQVPLSVEEILASRDQLRAEFAVEQRRIELRAAEISNAHAVDRSELGRRAAEILALKQRIETQSEEIRVNAAALTEAQQEIASLSGEHGALTAALYDADGLYKTKQEELAKLNQAHQGLSALADERLASHAAADARAAGLELRLGDVSRTLVEAEQRFTERTAHAARLNDALVVARSNLEVLEGNYAMLQKKYDAETRRIADLSQELDELRQQRDADQGKLRMLNIKVGVQETALEDAKQREAQVFKQRDQQIEKVRGSERAVSEKYEALRSDYATLEGALEAVRRRCESLESDLQQTRAVRSRFAATSEADENASLRQGVSEIGAAIVRLAQTTSDASPSLSAPDPDAQDSESLEMTNQGGN